MKAKCSDGTIAEILGKTDLTDAKMKIKAGVSIYQVLLVSESDTVNGSCVKVRIGTTTYRLKKKL